MEFHEFPKMLYRGEAQRIVANAEEEQEAVSEGWGGLLGGAVQPDPVVAESVPARRRRKAAVE